VLLIASPGGLLQKAALDVFSSGQYYARFMLTSVPGARPPVQARLVALTLADMAGRALGAARPRRPRPEQLSVHDRARLPR
jgi:hypothetical protein